MSGGATPYAEGRMIDFTFGTAPSAGTGVAYVALHTGATPASGNEVTGGGYARQALGAYTKSGGDPTTATNNNAINFPTATAAYGTVSSFSLWDASSGGNMLAAGVLSAAKPINSGDQARFIAGALSIIAD